MDAGFLYPGHMETEIATLHHYINIWHLQSTVGCKIAGTVTVSVFIDIYISIIYTSLLEELLCMLNNSHLFMHILDIGSRKSGR